LEKEKFTEPDQMREAINVKSLKSKYEKAIKKEQALSSLMLMNLVKYKQAKASGNEKAIAKYTKIAGDLSPKKKDASVVANDAYQAYEDAISGLHADAELQIDEASLGNSLRMAHLARGLKPLLIIGSTIKSTVGEDALLDLSDKFEDLDDENADDIASHLNMGIELMQDRSPSEARGWLKKFNKACKDALKGKSTKSAFEGVNESMIGIKTKANFKPLQLKGALDRAKIKGYQMNRLSVTLTALKLDKKDFDGAKKIIDDLGLKVMMAKESVNGEGKLTEATGVWKRFDAMQKLQGQAMDIEMDMKSITKDLKLAHREMEQEAEPEGGEIADRYADQIDKLEKEYKKKKVELKKVFAKLDKLEQF